MFVIILLNLLCFTFANPFHKYPYVFLLDVGNEEIEKFTTNQIRISAPGGSIALRYPAIGNGDDIAHVRVSGIDFGTDLKANIMDGGPGSNYVVLTLMGNEGTPYDAVVTIKTVPNDDIIISDDNTVELDESDAGEDLDSSVIEDNSNLEEVHSAIEDNNTPEVVYNDDIIISEDNTEEVDESDTGGELDNSIINNNNAEEIHSLIEDDNSPEEVYNSVIKENSSAEEIHNGAIDDDNNSAEVYYKEIDENNSAEDLSDSQLSEDTSQVGESGEVLQETSNTYSYVQDENNKPAHADLSVDQNDGDLQNDHQDEPSYIRQDYVSVNDGAVDNELINEVEIDEDPSYIKQPEANKYMYINDNPNNVPVKVLDKKILDQYLALRSRIFGNTFYDQRFPVQNDFEGNNSKDYDEFEYIVPRKDENNNFIDRNGNLAVAY